MDYRLLGGSGFKVPVLSSGTGTSGGGNEFFKACGSSDVAKATRLVDVVDALDEAARETGKTVPQVALNWLLQRPSVASVIVGARNEEQLRQNLGAVGWNLTAAQVARLDAASAVTLAYPYWHQRGFAERNPPPV
jgi:aryl-alcohol dehydrogenase-like predicted oxidoreductase